MEVSMALPGTQYRQGDLLLVAEASLPPGLEAIPWPPHGQLALVVGSAEGSHHLPAVPGLRLHRRPGSAAPAEWLEITGRPITVEHHQHAPLTLEPGLWRVVRQREHDPTTGPRPMRD